MAACGNYGQPRPSYGGGATTLPAPALPNPNPDEDCEDCVQVVKTTKRVRVPCHRNTYKQYTVKVPRTITEQCPKTVTYTEMENRQKQTAYTVNRPETRYRMENQNYTVPVTKCVTKMVNVTRKVPKTIYVDVTTTVPKQENVTSMETRCRQVKIPYTVNVPETKYRTENYMAPVTKSKTIMESRQRTIYDTQVRTRCEPKVTYVTKDIPVYNVVARPAQPCPPDQPCGPDNGGGAISPGLQNEFNSIDTNNDGMISAQEYSAARQPPTAQPVGPAPIMGGGGGGYGGGASAALGGGSYGGGASAALGGGSYGGAEQLQPNYDPQPMPMPTPYQPAQPLTEPMSQ